MAIIENFAALSDKERMDFATNLVNKINSDVAYFAGHTDFKITEVYADEASGDLVIATTNVDPLFVTCKATWQAADEDDTPEFDDIEYKTTIYDVLTVLFENKVVEIDGYKVTLNVNDILDDDIDSFEAVKVTHEDSGIGSYSYWGDVGYDSRPYVEVEGLITHEVKDCDIVFWVEPII